MSKPAWKQIYWAMRIERLTIHPQGITVEGRPVAGGTVEMGPRRFEMLGAKENSLELGDVLSFSCVAMSPASVTDEEVEKTMRQRALVEVKP